MPRDLFPSRGREWVSKVGRTIEALLPNGLCSKDAVAAELGLSARVLTDRLGEVGATYTGLLDETRRDLAMRYLVKRRYSVTKVSMLLGYSDASNFARAFRRWAGVSPTDVRSSDKVPNAR